MSITLDQALQGVDLESGRTYHCRVGDVRVELRVFPVDGSLDVTSDTMLDAWTELPYPQPHAVARCHKGVLPQPDVPFIPAEDDPA
jgi:hypothetical protein